MKKIVKQRNAVKIKNGFYQIKNLIKRRPLEENCYSLIYNS